VKQETEKFSFLFCYLLFLMGFQPKPDHISFIAKESKQRKTKKSRFLFCKPAIAGNKKTLSSQTRFAQTSSQA